jgi:hypothetical protein
MTSEISVPGIEFGVVRHGFDRECLDVGAAEALRVSGVAASQPAGVAIAPAKQRRVRTIVIRVSAIVGAGAAVGTVAALTRATPSKPPGRGEVFAWAR